MKLQSALSFLPTLNLDYASLCKNLQNIESPAKFDILFQKINYASILALMCGIIGIIENNKKARDNAIYRALPVLENRGPDANNIISFESATLGHTRLSIIDLTTGDQPMKDNKVDLAITFNGEIYNYKILRKQLEGKGHSFTTTSDTEVILKAYVEYGDECPSYLTGQFAFAIWDNKKERLFLARDRFGEKPLFYSQSDNSFIFASEIKAIIATNLVNKTLDHTSIDNYLALYFIPPWRSIYRDITPLPPAHSAVFENGKFTSNRYWSIARKQNNLSYKDAATSVRDLLIESTKSSMVADVEVGVFLSGGIDSSITAALAQKSSNIPLKSFAAGFGDYINELPYAKEVAEHVGTQHFEKNVEVSIDNIRNTTRYYDEPMGDSSNVPTGLISKLARQKVKVVLSGDGGDELFFGYGHYRAHWHLPKIKKLLALALGFDPEALYKRSHLNMFSVRERKNLWLDTNTIESDPTSYVDLSAAETPLQKVNLLDMYLKLPGNMLAKVDRSSMMYSLEVRSPFLNHELAEFAFNLPDEYKTNHTHGKIILKEAFSDLLPQSVFHRKKQGFGAPVKHWLKEPKMEKLVRSMFLDDSRTALLLNVNQVRTYIDSFYNGNHTLSYKIWMLFALELWMREHEESYSI